MIHTILSFNTKSFFKKLSNIFLYFMYLSLLEDVIHGFSKLFLFDKVVRPSQSSCGISYIRQSRYNI